MTPDIANEYDLDTNTGVLVVRAADNSPLQNAGVRAGDIIVRFNGENLESIEQLQGKLRKLNVGEVVELLVVRRSTRVNLRVKLAENSFT
jgi:serine protease Do